ncbi:MAG TPA: primosomal protein N' [Gemmatimonadales bacterium]
MFAHITFPLPVFEPYTYAIPESLADRVVPGARVVVPVRRQELIGLVTATHVEAPPSDRVVKDILGLPDLEPALSPPLLELGEWIARYYGAPLGLVIRAMLPGGMWGRSSVVIRLRDRAGIGGVAGDLLRWLAERGGEGSVGAASRALRRPVWDVVDRLTRVGAVDLEVRAPPSGPAAETERVVQLAGEPLTLIELDRTFARRPRQRQLYEVLEHAGGAAPWRHLRERLGFHDGVIRGLVGARLARVETVERFRDPFAEEPVTPLPGSPTADQADAVRAIGTLEPGSGAVLFGVTGSGKTLVYLECIGRALAEGRGAILLVPEIGLTPQTVSRVRGAFGDTVAVLHSGLSEGERADAWRVLRRGERRVVVGARSAIFAPVARLGLIIVDEEQETSYKNGETPRYHAREVAAVRARLEEARFVLGSATPSLETFARIGPRLLRVDLPRRIASRPLPPVTMVDLRSAPLVRGTGGVPWSELLDEAVRATLDRGDQVLLLLNRRGYAAFLQCRACGEVPECPRCSISLTVHRTPAALRCHYCDHRATIPTACAVCGERIQSVRGVGTQQLERLIGERFPSARIARMDLDTTSAKWSHHRILGAVARGDVDVLLGTQMIAKGIDLPEVTLVGVVDADLALHLPDFRAGERTFQLLTQVAGRAGRGERAGAVVIQTRHPGHHALRWAARHDSLGFLDEERRLRESPPYPPGVALVNLLVSGPEPEDVAARAAALADWVRGLAEHHDLALQVLGPAPCPVARIKSRWRWHVLIKGPAEALGPLVRATAPRLGGDRRARIAMDRDPVTLL